MKLAYLLMGVALLLSSCSEDIFPGGSESNEDVTISLAYSDVSPRDIVVNSRATDAEERHLDNLYIYIFDGNGNLKGYKGIEGADSLNQSTSSSETEKQEITGIKTRSGDSYIYAVANISTGLYPVATSNGTVEPNKLPINLDEDKACAGEYEFTLDQLKALTFNRNNPNTIQIPSAFLMSGAVQEGNLVNITTAGTIENGGNDIRLRRIVSKVKFTIKEKTGDVVNRSFKLANYDIMNIAMNGTLIGSIDGNDKKKISNNTDVSNIVGLTLGVNDVDETGAEYFEAYLPENLQDAKQDVKVQEMREDDNKSNPKVFTNAPKYGTYVVLKGKYEETTKDGSTITADVTYYVHLGDCSVNHNDYNVERNCNYTFNITVAGVNKIIVEATKEGNEQPGAEGVVLKYGNTGKNLTLDSHYEYMVMRFNQADIKKLKDSKLGYYYQVYALGKKTEPINVKDEANPTTQEHQKQLNGVDTKWIEFAITGRNKSKSIYGDANDGRGTPCDYPGKSETMDIETFLQMLYANAKNDKFWNNRQYIDATCFISENYYDNLTWDKYVNNVDKRAFYVANNVWVSEDTRSVYAEAQYGLTQHNIQTFYDRSQAGSVIAYGCETINDEEGKGFTDDGIGGDSGNNANRQYMSYGSDTWNGRSNMLKDIFKTDWRGNVTTTPRQNWSELKTYLKQYKSLVKSCMSRNRDLNGDGKISQDEVRWYAPALDQYAGLWIGEEAMGTEAKLYNKNTSDLVGDSDRMLYYTSTSGVNTYFSEEGMATNNHFKNKDYNFIPTLVRCVRNLKSNAIGYDEQPDKFYSTSGYDVELDKVDNQALNVTGDQGELNEHEERSAGNKPAKSFRIAAKTYPENNSGEASMESVVYGRFKCYGNYNEEDRKWRVPNQREMSVMYLINPNLINMAYCRTKFSNINFRKSWTYTSVFTMATNWSDYSLGKVRCIKVLK
ncbi:fimbrial protein [Prevotella sp. Sow4_E9_plate]|uniref:DUF4906 domain-containing protein n=1 Tax=Prevotella sp. Sow4_E9_plate TaxID=3438802 RepID=UPI003F95C5B8